MLTAASAVPLGAGRLQGEIVELQYTPTANSSTRGRLWRARHPNHDSTFPTIWGGGYLTASGGLGYLPCKGESEADVLASSYEIEIAGERYAAEASLKPMYDPKAERVRA